MKQVKQRWFGKMMAVATIAGLGIFAGAVGEAVGKTWASWDPRLLLGDASASGQRLLDGRDVGQ